MTTIVVAELPSFMLTPRSRALFVTHVLSKFVIPKIAIMPSIVIPLLRERSGRKYGQGCAHHQRCYCHSLEHLEPPFLLPKRSISLLADWMDADDARC